MKHFYFLLFFLGSTIILSAQDITLNIDNQLQLLDKSQITTDILYDRIFPLANLKEFNMSTADTSNVNHFFQAYFEIQKSDYNSRWNDVNVLKQSVQNYSYKIPIGIINVDYEYIDEEAISDNLIDFQGTDSLLVDVPGRPRTPYIKKNSSIISTLKAFTESKSVTFILGSSFNMVAAANSIQNIQADFKNGQGIQSLPLAGEKTINYSNPGIYHIKFKITYNDNTIKYTYCSLEVFDSSKPMVGKIAEIKTKESTCYSGEIGASRGFQGYDEPIEYFGAGEFLVHKGGTYYDKPVIVLDGFDPFQGMEDGIDNLGIFDQFLAYDYGAGNLGDDLIAQGYDIITLDFTKSRQTDGKILNGGTDYIERNAMVLIELIEKINTSNCWSQNLEPIKIIGFSMGGLVGRYALRYMEQNNLNHNTNLFVSVDSPHNGAVVPMGVQEMVDFIDDVSNIDVADKVLKSPAAKQMIIHHYLSNSDSPEGAPGFHEVFYNTLNSMGFPQQTRNIAVVNGTSKGLKINEPNQKYFDGDIETGLIFPFAGVGADANMHFSPIGGQTKKVFDFRAKIRFLYFYFTVYRRSQSVTSSTIYGSLENSPGGFFTVEDEINTFLGPDGIFNTNNNFLLNLIIQAKLEISTPEFSFIPVKSSLAYNGNNEYLYDDFSNRNLVCTGETPFDSYFSSTLENEKHIFLSSDKAQYIFDEINGNLRSPNVQVTSDDITGPLNICSENIVYSIPNCGATVENWTVSSNLEIINQSNSYITVKPYDSSISNSGFVQANFSSLPSVTKNIFIGKSDVKIAPLDSNAPFNEAWSNITGDITSLSDQGVSQTPTFTKVSETGGPVQIYISKVSEDFYNIRGVGNNNYWYTVIDVFIQNTCGTTVKRVHLTPPPPQDPCTYNLQSTEVNTYAILPPPDDPCLNSGSFSQTENLYSSSITKEQLYKKEKRKDIFRIEVYDIYGVKLLETKQKKINIDHLRNGLYIIKGYWNKNEFTKKVHKVEI